MQNPSFEHLARRLQFPAAAAREQAEFNKRRLAAVERALRFRPQFFPLTHVMPGASQAAPIVETTDIVRYPVILTGAITNGENREARFYRNRNQLSLTNYGNEPGLKLSLDAIAGHDVATAGYAGVKDFEHSLLVGEGDYLTLEIFDTALVSEIATCFNGVRCYRPDHAEAQLSQKDRDAVLQAIAGRPAPVQTYDVLKVEFDSALAGGKALVTTPLNDEPVMILGHRTTLDAPCKVSFGYTENFGFSENPIPSWALLAEPLNAREVWNMLPEPIFLAPRQQLKYVVTNSLDDVVISSDGNIEVLKSTV